MKWYFKHTENIAWPDRCMDDVGHYVGSFKRWLEFFEEFKFQVSQMLCMLHCLSLEILGKRKTNCYIVHLLVFMAS